VKIEHQAKNNAKTTILRNFKKRKNLCKIQRICKNLASASGVRAFFRLAL
jgi:hypothetical protein